MGYTHSHIYTDTHRDIQTQTQIERETHTDTVTHRQSHTHTQTDRPCVGNEYNPVTSECGNGTKMTSSVMSNV